jgi:predicted DNA-binding transcriptional regulator AlpA
MFSGLTNVRHMSKRKPQTPYAHIGRAHRERRLQVPRLPTSPPERHGDRWSGDDGDDDAARKFLTGPQVCLRYAITDMSLWRWLRDPALNFPPPAMRIRDRRYWLLTDLLAWERGQLQGEVAVDCDAAAPPI